jgi:hypothetical protein
MSTTFIAKPADVADAFATVLPHVGGDDYLPMLTVVNVQLGDGEIVLAATDRYTLAAYRTKLDDWVKDGETAHAVEPITVNLRASDLRRVFAFTRADRKTPAKWNVEVERVTVELGSGEVLSVRTMETEFVNWRKILSEVGERSEETASVVGLNPSKLAKLTASADAVRRIHGDRPGPMLLWAGASRLKPVFATVGSVFVGLIMPVRLEHEPSLDFASFLPAAADLAVSA